jgi:hypothetical protein
MVIAALLSTNLRPNGTRMSAIFTLAAGLLAGGCSIEPIAEIYRWSSDSLNNVAPAPAPGPWRLSKLPQNLELPYPKLGDMPPRPVGLETPEEMEQQVRLLQMEAGRAAASGKSKPDLKTAISGAPPPAQLAPLAIPARSRSD